MSTPIVIADDLAGDLTYLLSEIDEIDEYGILADSEPVDTARRLLTTLQAADPRDLVLPQATDEAKQVAQELRAALNASKQITLDLATMRDFLDADVPLPVQYQAIVSRLEESLAGLRDPHHPGRPSQISEIVLGLIDDLEITPANADQITACNDDLDVLRGRWETIDGDIAAVAAQLAAIVEGQEGFSARKVVGERVEAIRSGGLAALSDARAHDGATPRELIAAVVQQKADREIGPALCATQALIDEITEVILATGPAGDEIIARARRIRDMSIGEDDYFGETEY